MIFFVHFPVANFILLLTATRDNWSTAPTAAGAMRTLRLELRGGKLSTTLRPDLMFQYQSVKRCRIYKVQSLTLTSHELYSSRR